MLNLVIRNELLYPNAVLMGILFFAGCALLGWVWQSLDRSSPLRKILIYGLVTLLIMWSIGMVFCHRPDHDEIEHASAAWQISRGLLPFQDFFQHHSPILWILVAPCFISPSFPSIPSKAFGFFRRPSASAPSLLAMETQYAVLERIKYHGIDTSFQKI